MPDGVDQYCKDKNYYGKVTGAPNKPKSTQDRQPNQILQQDNQDKNRKEEEQHQTEIIAPTNIILNNGGTSTSTATFDQSVKESTIDKSGVNDATITTSVDATINNGIINESINRSIKNRMAVKIEDDEMYYI